MIPIRDTVRSRTFPVVNWLLIGLNVLVFLYENSLSQSALNRLISNYGIVPARINLAHPIAMLAHPLLLAPLLTHMFLHGGWLHILSNMWVLFIFGDNVEDRMGHSRYLLFYLLSGFVAALVQVLAAPASHVPSIGASGAIAGVLGAYILLYPRARVLTLIPLFFLPWLMEIPAIVFLGFWFISQLFSGLLSLGVPNAASMGGVAWFAHIGGFLFGMLFYGLFVLPRPPNTSPQYPNQLDRN